ncbi:hypothetical protein HDA40_003667 [Hamadaea flava]|uniref:DUF3105 domain-containing protein n=1 Tax=Hamadaea flava TaxID=1742688 RepID=A0ABV8LK81_9ACTN|nr:DUF3105 domain-containing protein [Hamadaea flava]MCP2325160.1 hypothetical protein [Hamadaea flava]
MSVSTPGENRQVNVVKSGKSTATGGKPPADDDKPSGSKSTTGTKTTTSSKPGGAAKPGQRPAGAGGKGRRPVTPVKVTQQRSWGPIGLLTAVILVAVAIVGFGAYFIIKDMRATSAAEAKQKSEAELEKKEASTPWTQRAAAIQGIVNYRDQKPAWLTNNHKQGKLTYAVTPSVGGDHNPVWQNCMGDVYKAPIATEHATHSLEHGAIWITYDSKLDAAQVAKLAERVTGKEYMLMSPVDNLGSPITLQAWGYQLKVDNADDSRIDAFVRALRKNASMESGASCSGGVTRTGTTPYDLGS